MNPLEQPLEQKLSQEARQRELLNLYEEEDWEGLLAAAELLNTAYSQQMTISKWLAHEAADNLGEAWQAHRRAHGQVQ
jgi:hypothetical protein